ncbi:MAG: hypothetical protein ACR2FR_07385 [Rubrobacter sp.]|nr:hypothetical protein [Actinomycetota bacterium]
MSGRTGRWFAWSVWALIVPTSMLTLLFASFNEPASSLWDKVLLPVLILAYSTVGALVASYRSENAIGWLFLSGAFVWIVGELTLEYGVYALITDPGALPAGVWAAWFGAWARGIGWFLLVSFLLLLFPTGRLPSPRWRPVLWGTAGSVALFTLASWLSPETNDPRLTSVRNPLGLESEIMGLVYELFNYTFPLLIVASGAAVIVRFRRSRGDERQQLKWFAYAVAVMVVVFLIWFSLVLTGLVPPSSLMYELPLIGLPVATGIAILKYRLYDIDFIVNRTLVYGSLTLVLALMYFCGIVILQRLFVALTSQQPTLAVVASTLLIAALFTPLRRRIQSFIDRRFYRRKYDAAKTLEAFSARLRDETDLDALSGDLVGVVRETMQPAHVSLWLHPTTLPKGEESGQQPLFTELPKRRSMS